MIKIFFLAILCIEINLIFCDVETGIPLRTLNNGNKMPAIGLGTFIPPGYSNDSITIESIRNAIKLGFRFFDTAYSYGQEREVGLAINLAIDEGLVKREDVWVVNKLTPSFFRKDRVRMMVEHSLKQMNMEYFDLYLLHAPFPLIQVNNLSLLSTTEDITEPTIDTYRDTWPEMIKLVEDGLVKNIGVSNFNLTQLQTLLELSDYPPIMNQVESHPFLVQKELQKFCLDNNIVFQAFSPLGGIPEFNDTEAGQYLNWEVREKIYSDPTICRLAKKYNKSNPQIALKFHVQRGSSFITRSLTVAHMKEDKDLFDWEMDDEDIKALEDLDEDLRFLDFRLMKDSKFYPFASYM